MPAGFEELGADAMARVYAATNCCLNSQVEAEVKKAREEAAARKAKKDSEENDCMEKRMQKAFEEKKQSLHQEWLEQVVKGFYKRMLDDLAEVMADQLATMDALYREDTRLRRGFETDRRRSKALATGVTKLKAEEAKLRREYHATFQQERTAQAVARTKGLEPRPKDEFFADRPPKAQKPKAARKPRTCLRHPRTPDPTAVSKEKPAKKQRTCLRRVPPPETIHTRADSPPPSHVPTPPAAPIHHAPATTTEPLPPGEILRAQRRLREDTP
jgi:hypothetical protein